MEQWKTLLIYNDYQVSNYGRFRRIKGNLLKIRVTTQPHIDLYKDGIKKTFIASRLIYKYFKGILIDGLVIDHIDNNPSNNHINNLQQISNRLNTSKDKKNKTSKYTGVSWDKQNNKWQANIMFTGVRYKIGLFLNEEDAAKAYKYVLEHGIVTVKKYHNKREYRNKGVNSKSKTILQYTLHNEFIEEHKSMVLASNKTGINRVSIGDCCKGKQNKAGNFIFKFK